MWLSRNKITYLAYQVSKDGVHPSDSNLGAIAECTLLQTYMEVHALLSLVGHYRRFIKEFLHIAQPHSEYLTREGARREYHLLMMIWRLSKCWNRCAWMTIPVLVFADYTKPFLLETDASKDGLMAVLSQKQADKPPCCPWQEIPNLSQKELSLNQTWIFWHWNGQLQNILRSTCPANHLWYRQIIIHSCT